MDMHGWGMRRATKKECSPDTSNGWQVMQAIANAPPSPIDDAASAVPDAPDPPSPAEDDAETLVMGNWPSADEEEEGEPSSSSEEEDDDDLVPNVAADSAGNIDRGLNLRALAVGPVPPTPTDSPADDGSDSEVESRDGREPRHEHGERAGDDCLVTPPPKRNDDYLGRESGSKKRKVDDPCPSKAADDVSWIDEGGAGGCLSRGVATFSTAIVSLMFYHMGRVSFGFVLGFGPVYGLRMIWLRFPRVIRHRYNHHGRSPPKNRRGIGRKLRDNFSVRKNFMKLWVS